MPFSASDLNHIATRQIITITVMETGIGYKQT